LAVFNRLNFLQWDAVLERALTEGTKLKKKKILELARARNYVAWYPTGGYHINLAGDYDYLEYAYYVSQDYGNDGMEIHPDCREMLDAYVPPLFLEKARLAGLSVPEYYISNGYFEPPVIIDPINPFMIKSRIVLKSGREQSIARSMTRNYTYAICCQELPSRARIARFRSVLGWSIAEKYHDISRSIWEIFRIPLATVRVIIGADGTVLLSDISQLPYNKLNSRELAYLERNIQWPE
jgi:hypothetical protein